MKAIVLSDSEHQRYNFLHELGMSVSSPFLCMHVTPTKIFDFQVFGLMTYDDKVIDYIKTRQGVIVIVNYSNVKNAMEKINYVVKNVHNIPILIKVENLPNYTEDRYDTTQNPEKLPQIGNEITELLKPLTDKPHIKLLFGDYGAKCWFNNMIGKSIVENKGKMTSITIPITEMAKKFQDCTLELEMWDHYGRLRIVDYSLMKYGYKKTIDPNGWLCTNWRKYKTSIGHGNLWNYTLTRFWANILYNLQAKNNYKSFNILYTSNPPIHNGKLFQQYYSNEVLFSDNAKNSWVEPNLIVKD